MGTAKKHNKTKNVDQRIERKRGKKTENTLFGFRCSYTKYASPMSYRIDRMRTQLHHISNVYNVICATHERSKKGTSNMQPVNYVAKRMYRLIT